MKDLRKGVYILPNLITSTSLFLGFYAIIHAIQTSISGALNYQPCALAIIASAAFDMMDGRVARKTNTATKFGVEYDSLADLVSFGVAPAVVMFLWTLNDLGRAGWLAAFLYMACGALRLARFNVQVTSVEKNFFQGLPIPMAAMMLSGALLIWEGKPVGEVSLFFPFDVQLYLLVFTYTLGALMVSSIPYRSFKSLSLTSRRPFYFLVFGVIGLMIWAFRPWWFLFMLGCLYLLSGPVERYILPKPIGAIQRVRKRRRVNKALDRIDEMSTLPPSAPDSSGETDENVHPIRRP
ncbi:MAG: CDP-diacylglycerol--serine O-phosphatidyltransferase [Pseudomonadota bacterium]